VPVFIMSYANPVVVKGVESFLGEARRAGAAGVIVPDLPADADEGLFARGRRLGLEVVPVVSPNTTDKRLDLLRPLSPGYLYAALRRGITGAYTEIGEENLAFLARLRTLGARILGGFGISSRQQVQALEPHVHAAVVGSALVAEIGRSLAESESSGTETDGQAGLYEAVRARMEELVGA
jgi:tryptophan synthase alpha chain